MVGGRDLVFGLWEVVGFCGKKRLGEYGELGISLGILGNSF